MTAFVLLLAGMFAFTVIVAAALSVPDWLTARGVDVQARLAPYGRQPSGPPEETMPLAWPLTADEHDQSERLLEQVWPR